MQRQAHILRWLVLCLSIQSFVDHSTLIADDRPNIIVLVADDLGYADIGIQGAVPDVKTPHLDALARSGVRCTAGYVTAPQCSPSRAGILTGQYQQRHGIDNNQDMPLPSEAITIAERLRTAGYACGMVGKWHLEPNKLSVSWAEKHGLKIDRKNGVTFSAQLARPYLPQSQGFDQFFNGPLRRYHANFDLQGNSLAPDGEVIIDERFRVDVQSDAAVAFINRNHEKPFFLYVGYYAPHVPLEASQNYLDRFPTFDAVRRRYALAMISAFDDGVGRIQTALKERGIDRKTLIVFLSDNGAPLFHKEDVPIEIAGAAWDGSVNDPWRGEKGMLSEGGLRVPMIWSWSGKIPEGSVEDRPVSSLDIAATAVAAAGLPDDPDLDGVNLVPYFRGEKEGVPHTDLYWRFWTQSAIRSGKWKYLKVGNAAEYLFDLEGPNPSEVEKENLIQSHPEIAAQLRDRLQAWSNTLVPSELPDTALRKQEQGWYETYFNLRGSESRKRNQSDR